MIPAPTGAAPLHSPLFGGGGEPSPCVMEFGKLRNEVQEKGAAAKNAGEHKVGREKMCKVVQAYSAAEAKWLKFVEAGVAICGIPREVANQLKQVHGYRTGADEHLLRRGRRRCDLRSEP
jgi:hypothetical protein